MDKSYDSFYIDIWRVVVAHEFVLYQNSKCDYSQGRNIYGISMAISGEAEYVLVSGERYKIRAGDIVFLPAEIAYYIELKGDYHHYTANFSIHNEHSVFDMEKNTISILHPENIQFYKALFSELCTVWAEKRFGYEMKAVMYIYKLMDAFICEKFILSLENNPDYLRVLPAKKFIESNYNKDISVAHLSKLCDMSETNFRRTFSRVFSQTCIQYRDKMVILHAKDYLSSGSYSVSEIALVCGFSDTSYFCRFFKKNTGLTPKKFISTIE